MGDEKKGEESVDPDVSSLRITFTTAEKYEGKGVQREQD